MSRLRPRIQIQLLQSAATTIVIECAAAAITTALKHNNKTLHGSGRCAKQQQSSSELRFRSRLFTLTKPQNPSISFYGFTLTNRHDCHCPIFLVVLVAATVVVLAVVRRLLSYAHYCCIRACKESKHRINPSNCMYSITFAAC